jgi:preprotein translocase subunit SecA
MANDLERDVMLQIIDQQWREHLTDMDYLRDGIYLRAVAQQDPLVAWQREGFALFEQLLANIDDDYVKFITHAARWRWPRLRRPISLGSDQREPGQRHFDRTGWNRRR